MRSIPPLFHQAHRGKQCRPKAPELKKLAASPPPSPWYCVQIQPTCVELLPGRLPGPSVLVALLGLHLLHDGLLHGWRQHGRGRVPRCTKCSLVGTENACLRGTGGGVGGGEGGILIPR